jgi:hypothetical protein
VPVIPMQPLAWHVLRRPALELSTLFYRVGDRVG